MATSSSAPPPADLAKTKAVDVNVTMSQHEMRPAYNAGPVPLWVAILSRRVDFTSYAKFINHCFDKPDTQKSATKVGLDPRLAAAIDQRAGTRDAHCLHVGHGLNAYELLKTATEVFLLLHCGVFIEAGPDGTVAGAERVTPSGISVGELQAALGKYLGTSHRLPYIERVIGANPTLVTSPFAEGLLQSRVECPCFLELIWSYWHEEGMLVQALNALSLRFQNRRSSDARDPLAQLELSPLRPLSSIFWGYVQDEQHRLSLVRRNYEYEHEYGIALRGKAVQTMRVADRRSKFIEAFHDLLFRCAQFIRDSANLQYNPNPFPLLTGLKEVHLILSQGAGNQFGDLPWTARVEMLMQQWILSRAEIREFLGRRPMVSYEEDWMANADAMKTIMGWTDTSVVHFHNLAVFGEGLLLSIRWHPWGDTNDATIARDWLNTHRAELEGYLYAYRVATGIDLSTEAKDSQSAAERAQNPSVLLERRLGAQRRDDHT
jgi:hypothetical protein